MRLLQATSVGLLLCCLVAALSAAEQAEDETFSHIRVVDFEGEIGAVLAGYLGRQVERAEEEGVDCLVVRIDSPGGTVRDSMRIADTLLGASEDVHIVAWVPKMAYSGAAMVSLACDEIVMGRDAHLGDAQPGMQVAEGWRPVGEKAESPLRAKFRNYAERNGYPTALAEAMVSASLEVIEVRDPDGQVQFVNGKDFREWDPEAEVFPGILRKDLVQVGPPIVREDELLTMTASEASRFGFLARTFADGVPYPEDEDAMLAEMKAENGVVEKTGMSFSERASRVLLAIAGLLAALVTIAIVVMIWQGPGIMTVVGAAALVLVIVIYATADQLHGFPIFLLVIGVLLLLVEIFLLPGFGVAGFLGVVALGAGFLFLAAGVTLDDSSGLTRDLTVEFGLQFVLTVLLGMGLLLFLSRLMPRVGPARRMVLPTPRDAATAPAPSILTTPVSVGQRGTAASPLRPSGSAEFSGALVDVTTAGDFAETGATVEVRHVEGNHVTVAIVDEDDA